jgi:hypothetical protein
MPLGADLWLVVAALWLFAIAMLVFMGKGPPR